MILSKSIYGSFKGNPFIIGTTNKNEYYPVYADNHFVEDVHSRIYYNGEQLMENIVEDIYLYKKPTNNAERRYGSLNKYVDLLNTLEKSVNSDVFEFTIADTKYYLNCNKGYISDVDDNILLILCTNSQIVFDNEGQLKFNNLRLYVSNDFIINPIYKNVFKKIDSEYIHFCYENNIEVMFTTSERIQNQVFKNDFKVNFNNLTELHEHLGSGIGDNLFFDEKDYLREYGLLPEPEIEEDAEVPF